jgi:nucleotide-binding universal stress UspA family protein
MSVVVGHQASTTGRLIIEEGAKEASFRHTSLSVVHVAEGVDVDLIEDQKTRLRNEITNVLEGANLAQVEWTLHVATGVDVAETVLNHLDDADVELLVIGARRRTPVGKLIMGSVTQSILLRADVPVLVVKGSARTRIAARASDVTSTSQGASQR